MLLSGLHPAIQADDFTQFRGQQVGVITNIAVPDSWSMSENVAWKVKLPGSGWSQPVLCRSDSMWTTAISDPPLRPKNFSDGVQMPQSMGLGGFTSAPNVTIDWQVICLDAITANSCGRIQLARQATSSDSSFEYLCHLSRQRLMPMVCMHSSVRPEPCRAHTHTRQTTVEARAGRVFPATTASAPAARWLLGMEL